MVVLTWINQLSHKKRNIVNTDCLSFGCVGAVTVHISDGLILYPDMQQKKKQLHKYVSFDLF